MSLSKYALFAFSFTLFAGSPSAFAQEFRSTLSGHITDPSGAVVPGAKITVVNNDTKMAYTAVTTQSGSYQIPYMLPGTYTVTTTAESFKTAVNNDVVLQGGQSSTLDIRLTVGAVSETVSVADTAPLLDAETAVGNGIVTTRELDNLPLAGRQVYNLIGTTPGSQFLQTQFGASGYSGTRGWDVSNNYVLGGGVQGYQQFTLNGANITQQNNGTGTWQLAPNVDALSGDERPDHELRCALRTIVWRIRQPRDEERHQSLSRRPL